MKDYSVIDGIKTRQKDILNTIYDTGFDEGYLQGVEDSKSEANQIAANAYKDGYEAGKEEIMKKQSMSARKVMDADYNVYNEGMNDAWELAKKINDMTYKRVREVFDTDGDTLTFVLYDFTAEEAMEKYNSWERQQKSRKTDKPDSIEIGDEVEITSHHGNTKERGIVMQFLDQGDLRCYDTTGFCFSITRDSASKTGRHCNTLKDISDWLQEMKDHKDDHK